MAKGGLGWSTMATRGVVLPPSPPKTPQTTMSCPSGWVGTWPNCSPKPATAAIGGFTPRQPTPTPSQGGLGASFQGLKVPDFSKAGSSWNPSALERPNLTPLNPQAAYDPEMFSELGSQRGFRTDYQQGTDFAATVATQQRRDAHDAELMQAEQAAAQAGIPFDRARFENDWARAQNLGITADKQQREQNYFGMLQGGAQLAGNMAGERQGRLGLDLKRQTTQNELALDRYGRDIQKYGIDAQASTAANNSLMGFYSQLMGGMFNVLGSGMRGGDFISNFSLGG